MIAISCSEPGNNEASVTFMVMRKLMIGALADRYASLGMSMSLRLVVYAVDGNPRQEGCFQRVWAHWTRGEPMSFPSAFEREFASAYKPMFTSLSQQPSNKESTHE